MDRYTEKEKRSIKQRYEEIFDEKKPSDEQVLVKLKMDMICGFIEETQKYKDRIRNTNNIQKTK